MAMPWTSSSPRFVGARDGQDRVTLFGSFGDGRFEQVDLIFDDRVDDRVGAPVREHGGEDGGVELRNVAGFQVGVAVDDLIAGRDDAEDRAFDDFHFIDTGSHEGADESGRHDGVGRNDHIAHADILTDLADVTLAEYRRTSPSSASTTFSIMTTASVFSGSGSPVSTTM